MGGEVRRWLTSAAVSRRIVAVVVALVAGLTLSACGSDPVSQQDVVARVDEAKLTRQDLDDLLNNAIVQGEVSGELDGDVAKLGSQADQVISLWISFEAISQEGSTDLDDEPTANSVVTRVGGEYQTSYEQSTGVTRDFLTRFIAFITQQQTGTLQPATLAPIVQSADVVVDSRYGYWDPARLSVIPFGQSASAPSSTGPS